ncbi:MAG TPA: arginine--tRNA ligase [bacterium]|nr:arginine--tRNA ligase [bacterium]
MPDAHANAIKAALTDAAVALGYAPPAKLDLREVPFEGQTGYGTALPLALAAQVRDRYPDLKGPALGVQIANDLKAWLEQQGRTDLGRTEVAPNGFLNFFIPKGDLVATTIRTILEAGPQYGEAAIKQLGRVMVEFSQPNTHKGFHIGHLRNVALGAALVNIYRAAGYDTLSANYYGDIGTHVIKALWGYRRFYKGMEPKTRRGTFLGEVYTFADQKYSAGEELKAEALKCLATIAKEPKTACEQELGRRMLLHFRETKLSLAPTLDKRTLAANLAAALAYAKEQAGIIDELDCPELQVALRKYDPNDITWQQSLEVLDTFAKWEAKDPELLALWRETKEWSLEEFREIYTELDVTFDVEFYESEEEDPGKEYVQELLAQGVAEIDQGAAIVRIDDQLAKRGLQEPGKERYRTLIILRADGSSLYATKDLSLARKKFQDFGISQSIYVVADEQAFYFQQIFKILELAGFEQAKDCFHLSYGLVTLPEGKMSSRKGNVVLYFDFAKEMLDTARRIVDAKQPDLPADQRAAIARMVGYGAMKYDMLKVDSSRTIVFDKDEALSLEGRTAPYIQYAHARACRILEKAQAEQGIVVDPTALGSPEGLEEADIELAKELAHLPAVIQKAAADHNPLPLSTYVYEVAQQFNDFYQKVPVLKAEDPALLQTRLGLVAATRTVLRNGLALLGIDAPEVM